MKKLWTLLTAFLPACSGAPFSVAPEAGTPFAQSEVLPDAGPAESALEAGPPEAGVAALTAEAASPAEASAPEAALPDAGTPDGGPPEDAPPDAAGTDGEADSKAPEAAPPKLCCVLDSCPKKPLSCSEAGDGYVCFDGHGEQSNSCQASSCAVGATCLPSSPSDCTGLGTVRECP